MWILMVKNFKMNMLLTAIGSILFCTFYWGLLPVDKFYRSNKITLARERQWRYECDVRTQQCRRTPWQPEEVEGRCLRTCQMSCGPLPLWPMPTGELSLSSDTATFHRRRLRVTAVRAADAGVRRLLEAAVDLFLEGLPNRSERRGLRPRTTDVDLVNVTVTVVGGSALVLPTLDADESYRLAVEPSGGGLRVTVRAGTFFGARHALDTLAQLIWHDECAGVLRTPSRAKVVDGPAFAYRGLMLDTAGRFLPAPVLRRTLDAMAMSKMNALHWRLSGGGGGGGASFALHYGDGRLARHGAPSPRAVYTEEDVRAVAEYAAVRGVRVLVEVENPGGAGRGWDRGIRQGKGNLTLCVDDGVGPGPGNASGTPSPDRKRSPGQLNPSNEDAYAALVDLLQRLRLLTGATDLVHLGGRHVDLDCWSKDKEVAAMKVFAKKGALGVLQEYEARLYRSLSPEKGGGPRPNATLWSGLFDLFGEEGPGRALDSRLYVAQVEAESWSGEAEALIDAGYRVVLSPKDKWRLDGRPHWSAVYGHRPWQSYARAQRAQVLGGEACLWTAEVGAGSLDALAWPAAAAFAEALWSDPQAEEEEGLAAAAVRLDAQRQRLQAAGVRAAPLGPKWCSLNPGQCL